MGEPRTVSFRPNGYHVQVSMERYLHERRLGMRYEHAQQISGTQIMDCTGLAQAPWGHPVVDAFYPEMKFRAGWKMADPWVINDSPA